jgi:ornithine decarboxylase
LQLHKIVSSVAKGTGSFYVTSKARLDRQLTKWKQELPKVKPYYAVKCNPEPNLIKWLAPHASFDCASSREIQLACEYAPRSDIVFANPCKKKEDIEFAQESGVQLTVVDSKEELNKLDECAWEGSSLIRIMVDDKGSRMPFSSKFGIHLTQALSIYGEAKRLGQKISGISFHVGSGCQDANQYYEAILNSNSLLSLMEPFNYTNKKDYIIDIGGGFEDHSFANAAASIRRSYGLIPHNIQLIAEPGRYFAASSHDLFVKVIGKKPAASGFRYTIDESLYGQFSCIPFDQAKPRWIRVRGDQAERRRCQGVLYGRTCDGLDLIAVGEAEELEVGDWLWFPNMGAYGSVTASEFNGFPNPPIIAIDDGLPHVEDFDNWPTNLRYVSHVKAPEY